MAERSRRDKSSKFDKLAELKRVREGGKRVWKVRTDFADLPHVLL